MKVKFCGFTNRADAENASHLEVDYLGFVTEIGTSPRSISVQKLSEISSYLKNISVKQKLVAVLQNPNPEIINKVLKVGVDIIQFHGEEKVEALAELKKQKVEIWKAFRVSDKEYEAALKQIKEYMTYADKILLDKVKTASIFTGKKVFAAAARIYDKNKIVLAGGLNKNNIQTFISELAPQNIDLSSGIENKPGVKSIIKMQKFLKLTKS